VGDTKFKRATHSDYAKDRDIYQMLAFTTTAKLPTGNLMCAEGEAAPKSHEIRGIGTRVEVRTLNLGKPHHEVLAQIQAIGDAIHEARTSLLLHL